MRDAGLVRHPKEGVLWLVRAPSRRMPPRRRSTSRETSLSNVV